VAAPFVGMLAVLRGPDDGSAQAIKALGTMAIICSIAVLGLYLVFTLRPPGHSAAAPFLLIPVCLWVAVAGMMFYAHANRE
jgi:tryptophan-rich sensory protein